MVRTVHVAHISYEHMFVVDDHIFKLVDGYLVRMVYVLPKN
jgi:hypothetical protein